MGMALAGLLVCVSLRAQGDNYPPFNVRLGTQTINPAYSFGLSTSPLAETAERIYAMGSDVIKIAMSSGAGSGYNVSMIGIRNLTELARDQPEFRKVFDMPFVYYQVWAYPLTVSGSLYHNWRDGLSETERTREYDEIYAFARYLFRQYNGSGKTFMLGHWEGDWALLGSYNANATPSNTAIQGMIDWYRIRQQAVDDARSAEPHANVFVWHYGEVNLVVKAKNGGVTVTNNVLPYCTLDAVSYSAYDSIFGSQASFLEALNYLASKAVTTNRFPKGVFIGEYGFPLDFGARTPAQQAASSKAIFKATLAWSAPFALYWQMYDNETTANGPRGFWLVNHHNQEQPVYFTHQDFFGRAHMFKNLYRFWLDRNPDEAAFSNYCSFYDTTRTSDFLTIVDSLEYKNRVSNSAFADWISTTLLMRAPHEDPERDTRLARLNAGVRRLTIVDDTLNGASFAARFSNLDYALMLHRGAWRQLDYTRATPAVVATANRLSAGVTRSALWREFLDHQNFYLAELGMRTINKRGARELLGKYFFDYQHVFPPVSLLETW